MRDAVKHTAFEFIYSYYNIVCNVDRCEAFRIFLFLVQRGFAKHFWVMSAEKKNFLHHEINIFHKNYTESFVGFTKLYYLCTVKPL